MTLFEQTVSNIADSGEVLLMGDFDVDPVNSLSLFDLFEGMLRFYNLSLVNSGPTRITTSTSSTLDRFIVSDITRVRSLSVIPVSSVADHELVMLSLGYTKPTEN
jgi:hypothetical protein